MTKADETLYVVQTKPVPLDEQGELFRCYLECSSGNKLVKLVLSHEAAQDLFNMLKSYVD